MLNNKKPLFSKPVLAGIMIVSTLAIWALNSTAQKRLTYPTIEITKWKTQSGIPVVWLHQKAWKKTHRLKMRFSFRAATHNLALTDATLSLMLDDPLSLVSSTINQRLSPLTANVSSYYDHEGQLLDVTMNSNLNFFKPTIEVLTQWLTEPSFKIRSFERWQRQLNPDLPALYAMQNALFITTSKSQKKTTTPITFTQSKSNINREQVRRYYKGLTQNVSRITLVGDMNKSTQQRMETALNHITQHFKPASKQTDTITTNLQSHTLPMTEADLGQTQSGIALAPIHTVKDWISLQIWGADLVKTLNQQNDINYTQLNLILSPLHPWAWWRIQHSRPNTTLPLEKTKLLTKKDFIVVRNLPSIQNKKLFDRLFSSFKQQLRQHTTSPEWWSKLATEVMQPGSALTPKEFAQHYQSAIDSFTQKDYKKTINHLLIASSYQESQVNP